MNVSCGPQCRRRRDRNRAGRPSRRHRFWLRDRFGPRLKWWNRAGRDKPERACSALLLQIDEAQKIELMTATFRAERGKPFRDIGEIARAPVHNSAMIAWDVLRDRKHTQVVATGADEKASTLKIMRIKHRDPAKGWFPAKQD